ATWTSGEPVSLALVAYSWMSSVLRSAVIDIGHILSKTRMLAAPAGMSSRWGHVRRAGTGKARPASRRCYRANPPRKPEFIDSGPARPAGERRRPDPAPSAAR